MTTTPVAPLGRLILEPIVRRALEEDFGLAGDITGNAVIAPDTQAIVVMAAREEGVIAGLDAAHIAFHLVDPSLQVVRPLPDGAPVKKGDVVMEISGNARAILAAERVALNFVGRMSGIATLTARMVAAVGNHKAKICSTRKTTPGLRAVEKYAVRAGGGANHRLGLDDAILIKDNHIAMAGGVATALHRARAIAGHMVKIEIEVDTLDQLKEVMETGADVVMLDNMTIAQMTEAVTFVDGRALVEASGGVTLDRIPAIAACGVDMISTGALTHSAPNFDVGLDYKAAA